MVNPELYGFREGHSITMAILDMVERVRAVWGKKNVTLGVFIDLKKAFDTVNLRVLLEKLEHYGVRDEAHGLLASYLQGREQYVVYGGGVESKRNKVEGGVPQGSVLEPLFFLFYVNNMVRFFFCVGVKHFTMDQYIGQHRPLGPRTRK